MKKKNREAEIPQGLRSNNLLPRLAGTYDITVHQSSSLTSPNLLRKPEAQRNLIPKKPRDRKSKP